MSKSWKLVNIDGSDNFEPNDMDIVWSDGRPQELTSPLDVLTQRVFKCTEERLGSNLVDPSWGSTFKQMIGSKLISRHVLLDVGDGMRKMVERLMSMQNEARQRIQISSGEMLAGISKLLVNVTLDAVVVSARLRTLGDDVDVSVSVPRG